MKAGHLLVPKGIQFVHSSPGPYFLWSTVSENVHRKINLNKIHTERKALNAIVNVQARAQIVACQFLLRFSFKKSLSCNKKRKYLIYFVC